MAKKTRTELSTLALNTNLPDNTTELITPTTERAQLTDERESVVNYKDDLGGVPNAGKFLTVAADGESLTMVDEPSGVPDWVTFQTAAINLMKLLSGSSSGELQFLYDDAGVDTIGARISWSSSGNLVIVNDFYQTAINLSNQINFSNAGGVKLIIETTGDLTHNADIMALNAQQAFSNSPLYTFKFQGKVTGSSGGVYTFEEFANIKGGKENATENDKAGYLSFTTGIADGTLTERLRISSGGDVRIGTGKKFIFEDGTATGNSLYRDAATGDTVLTGATDIVLSTSSTPQAMRITSGGVINSYYGIAFPNQSAGSGTVSSSTLDAYEEGTWTPSVISSGTNPTVTYISRSGNYVRIGKSISVWCKIQIATSTGGTGNLIISGLPYTVNVDADECGGSIGLALGFTVNPTVLQADGGTTIVYVMANVANSPITDLDFTYLRFNINYLI